MGMQNRIDKLREALADIRAVASISEGVEWYAMIADRALMADDLEEFDDNKEDGSA